VLNAVVCSRVRGLQKALSAGTIALEISSRNARVTALPKRWDRLRASLDLIRDQRGADMADLPCGAWRVALPRLQGQPGPSADRNLATEFQVRPRPWHSNETPARHRARRRMVRAGPEYLSPSQI
jgi:hypothetical protein